MTKLKWTDETGYSKGAKGVDEPRVWKLLTANKREIMVHRHIDRPGEWLLSCRPLGLEKKGLKAKDVEVAKTEALALLERTLLALSSDFEPLFED